MRIQENDFEKSVMSTIRGIVNDVLGQEFATSEDTAFHELGMDSIMFIRFIVELESAFDIECDDDLLSNIYNITLKDVADYVKKQLHKLSLIHI